MHKMVWRSATRETGHGILVAATFEAAKLSPAAKDAVDRLLQRALDRAERARDATK